MKKLSFAVMILLFILGLFAISGVAETTDAYEIYKEDDRLGVRLGEEVITDAIWQNVELIETSKGVHFIVKLNDKYGILDEKGNIVVEPLWADKWKAVDNTNDYILLLEVTKYNKGTIHIYRISDYKDIEEIEFSDTWVTGCSLIGERYLAIYQFGGIYIKNDASHPNIDYSYSHMFDMRELAIIEADLKDGEYLESVDRTYFYLYDLRNEKMIIDKKEIITFDVAEIIYHKYFDPRFDESNKTLKNAMTIKEIEELDGIDVTYTKLNDESDMYVDGHLLAYINSDGEVICCDYARMDFIGNTYEMTLVGERRTSITITQIFDFDGNELEGSPIQDWIGERNYYKYDDKIVAIEQSYNNAYKGKYVFIDFDTATTMILDEIDKVKDFSDGMAAVQNAEGKWGYINTKGEMVYDFLFDDAPPFKDGTATVVYNYKKVTLDKEGNME